jgi:hypothetical protein
VVGWHAGIRPGPPRIGRPACLPTCRRTLCPWPAWLLTTRSPARTGRPPW